MEFLFKYMFKLPSWVLSSVLEQKGEECCWCRRLWSCFSDWIRGNIHPSSDWLGDPSSDWFKWDSWRPRRGGRDGSLGNWWHWEGGLSSSLLLAQPLVLLIVECMGNVLCFRGVGAWLVWFGAPRQNAAAAAAVVVACFPPLTQFEPVLLPGFDLMHWQRSKRVCVSSQLVDRVSTFKLESLSMWSFMVSKLTITSWFPQARGETLLSLKRGKMLKCCTKCDSYAVLGCLGVQTCVLFCCRDCSHRSSEVAPFLFPWGTMNSNWPFTFSLSIISPAVSGLFSVSWCLPLFSIEAFAWESNWSNLFSVCVDWGLLLFSFPSKWGFFLDVFHLCNWQTFPSLSVLSGISVIPFTWNGGVPGWCRRGVLKSVCPWLWTTEKTSAWAWISVWMFLWLSWGDWVLYGPEQKSCNVSIFWQRSGWKVRDWKVSSCVPSSFTTIDGAEEGLWMPEVNFLLGACWLTEAFVWTSCWSVSFMLFLSILEMPSSSDNKNCLSVIILLLFWKIKFEEESLESKCCCWHLIKYV